LTSPSAGLIFVNMEGERKYQSAREYSKKEIPEERLALAEKIHGLQSEHFQSDRELDERINKLLGEAEAGKLAAEEAVRQIQVTDGQLLQFREGLISRLVHFREIQRLEEKKEVQKLTQEKFDEQYRSAQELVSGFQEQRADDGRLHSIEGLLHDFYSEKENEWNAYEKEQQERDVENVLAKYNVAIVHALTPRGGPESNSLIRSDIPWEEKLKIVLAFEPTISTSAISPEQQGMWAGMGVLLNGGSVEVASPSDAATIAEGSKRIVTHSSATYDFSEGHTKPIEQQLQETISYHHEGDFMNYNEVIVSNPEVAGFFARVKEDNSLDVGVSAEEIFPVVEKIHMPVFAVKKGEVYRIDPSLREEVVGKEVFGIKTYKTVLKLGEKVMPRELASLPGAISKEQKEQFANELMEDSPFLLTMAEARLADSRNAGRETYIGVNFAKLNEAENVPTEVYQSSGKYESHPKFVGKEVKVLGEVKSPVATYRSLSIDGRLFTQLIKRKTGEVVTYDRVSRALERGDFYINTDYGQTFGGAKEKPMNSTNAYLEKMHRIFNGYRKLIEEAKRGSREDTVAFYEHRLRESAFHLYGFADEASEHGDMKSKEATDRLAFEIMPRGEYEEIVKRRVGPNGEFRISREDLRKLKGY